MNDKDLLVRDLYAKYAPNEFSEDKIAYVNENYEDPQEFVRDFYAKYAPDKYGDEVVSYINENYLNIKKKDKATSEDLSTPQEQPTQPSVESGTVDPLDRATKPYRDGKRSTIKIVEPSQVELIQQTYDAVKERMSSNEQTLTNASEWIKQNEDAIVSGMADQETIAKYNVAVSGYNELLREQKNLFNTYGDINQWAQSKLLEKKRMDEKALNIADESLFETNPQAYLGSKFYAALKGFRDKFVIPSATSVYAQFFTPMSDEEIENRVSNLPKEAQDEVRKALQVEQGKAAEIKTNAMKVAIAASERAAETNRLANIPETFTEIDNPLEAINYTINVLTETAGQIPLTVLTGGTSSMIIASGLMYEEAVQQEMGRLMEQEGLSKDEALARAIKDENINKLALNAGATAVAALDFAGAKGIMGGLSNSASKGLIKDFVKRNVVKNVLKKTAPTGVEVVTELSQEGIEAGSISSATGGSFAEGVSELTVEEMMEVSVRTMLGAGGVNVLTSINNESFDSKVLKAVDSDSDLKSFAFEYIENKAKNGDITPERATELRAKLDKDLASFGKLKNNIPEENMDEAVQLQNDYEAVVSQMSENSALKPFLSQKKKEIEEKMVGLMSTEETKTDIDEETVQEEPVLEGVSNDRDEEERGKESPELRQEGQQEEVTPSETETITQESGAETTQESNQNVETATAEKQEGTPQERKQRIENEIDGIVEKVKARKVKDNTNPQVVADAVIPYLQGSKVYEEMNDTQREEFYRETMKRLGFSQKQAPSANKVLAKVNVPPKRGFTTKQLLEMAEEQDKRGIKEGKGQEAEKVRTFEQKIKNFLKDRPEGILNNTQASQIAKAAAGVRTPSQMRRFEDVAQRVMDNAEYAEKLSKAQSMRSKLAKRSKSKVHPSNLTRVMADFAKIDPSTVPDLDQYMLYAGYAYNAIGKASLKGGELSQPKTIPSSDIYKDYIDRHNDIDEQQVKKDLIADFEYLAEAGIIDESMSLEDIESIIDGIYSTEDKAEKITSKIKDISPLEKLVDFTIDEAMVRFKSEIENGDLSELAKEQMEILENTSVQGKSLTPKELGELYLYLQNYILNGRLNGISTITAKLEVGDRIDKHLSEHESSSSLGKFLSGTLKALANVTQIIEAVNKNERAATSMYGASAIIDFNRAKTVAQDKFNDEVNRFVDKYIGKKPILAAKNTPKELENVKDRAERAMFAQLRQFPKEQYQEALDYIDQSIKYYESGLAGDRSRDIGKSAREAFEAKFRGTTSASQVEAKISKKNKELIDWWVDTFDKYKKPYFENAEIVHNRSLMEEGGGKYTPLASKSKQKVVADDTFENPAAFLDKVIIPNRSGSTNERKYFINPRSRYMDLDFETSMFHALEKNINDIETSFQVKKIAAFFNNPKSVDMFGSVDLHSAFKNRIKDLVNTTYANSEFSAQEGVALSVLNYGANLSARFALGAYDQSLKQFFPVMAAAAVNTNPAVLADAFGAYMTNKASRDVFKGYPVSRRSIKDQDMRRVYNRIPEGKRSELLSKFKKYSKAVDQFSEDAVMSVIQSSDKAAAQISWMAFYKNYMDKNKLGFKGWNKEAASVNKEAAAYAEMMVNNTQNVSDIDMQSNLFKTTSSSDIGTIWNLFRRASMPFQSFAFNQAVDISLSLAKGNFRRAGARMTEQTAFVAIKRGLLALYSSAALGVLSLMGIDNDEEDEDINWEKEWANIIGSAIMETIPFIGISDDYKGSIARFGNEMYFKYVLSEKDRMEYYPKDSKFSDEKMAKLSEKNPDEVEKILEKAIANFSKSGEAPLFDPSIFPDQSGLAIGASGYYEQLFRFTEVANEKKTEDGTYLYEYETVTGYKVEVELNEKERNALLLGTGLEALQSPVSPYPRDVANLGRKVRQKVTKSAKKREKDEKKKKKSMFPKLNMSNLK